MNTTAHPPEPLARRAAIVAVLGMLALIVVDFAVGTRAFGVVKPALAADVVVLGALVVAFSAPGRLRLAATLVAAAGSIVISRAVDMVGFGDYSPLMGRGAWPGFGELAGLGFLVAWCLRSCGRAGAVAAWIALGAALIAVVEWRQRGPYWELLMLLVTAAWLSIAVAGLYLRYLDHVQQDNARQVRQDERIAIARELHDMVAHHVTGIVVQAQAARLVAADRPDAAARALGAIERAGAEALGAMRMMVGTLRDESAAAELAPSATVDDLRAIGEPPGRGEVPVRLTIDERAEALPSEVVASLHRIAREAVTNARRHATSATRIDVDVACRNGNVHLLVSNDGAAASRSSPGYGLTGMTERAAALGGRLTAGPLAAGGWRVTAEFPVHAARP